MAVASTLLPVVSHGQTVSEQPTVSLQELGYRLNRWSVDHGLPSGFVFSVIQSPDGYLWAATLNGLSRYDGRRFTPLRSSDSSGILFRRPHLHVDERGRLWIVSWEGGMVVTYEDGELRRWEEEEGIPKDVIRLIDGTGKGSPYIHVRRSGEREPGILFRNDEGRFQEFAGAAPPGAEDLYEDRSDGTLWAVVSNQNGWPEFCRVDSAGLEVVLLSGPGGEEPGLTMDLFRNQAGELSLLTSLGIFVRRNSEWKLERKFPGRLHLTRFSIAGASEDWRGNVWIVSRSGLHIVRPDGSVLEVGPSPFAGGMGAPYVDREGSVWIPTKGGLLQFVPAAFTSWRMEEGLTRQKVFRASEDGEGRMWFAGEKTVYFLSPNEARIQAVPGKHAACLAVAGLPGPGAYALGDNNSLYFVRPDVPLWGSKMGVAARGAFLHATREGTLWTSSRTGLVRIAHPEAEQEEIPLVKPGQRAPRFGMMVEDSTGRKFLSIQENGVYQLDAERRPRLLNPEPTPEAPWTLGGLLADPEDNIWLSSTRPAGLGLWDSTSETWFFAPWSKLNLPVALPADGGLICDRVGGFWRTTTGGLLRCDLAQLAEAVKSGGGSVVWDQFHQEDGLETVACSHRADASCLDSRGRLWIPTDAGVSMTDPEAWHGIRERIPAPPLQLTGFEIDGEEMPLDESAAVTVPPNSSILEIDYNALHFSNPGKVHYRYRLLGYEETWNEADNMRRARYQKVPSGKYRFEVTADNGYGVWNEVPATLAIEVLPQWWERTSVRLAGVALVLLGIYALYSARMRALNRRNARQVRFSRQLIDTQEAERQRIAHELHDGLGQEMLVLKGRLELAALRHSEAAPDLMELSTEFSDTIEQTRSISHNLCPPHLENFGLSSALEALAIDVLAAATFELETSIERLDPRLDRAVESAFYRIAQESLANVIKHAEANRVSLELLSSDREVTLRVADDGKGFGVGSVGEAGLGLGGMAERAQLVGALFSCESSPGRGTVIIVTILQTTSIP